MRIYTNLFEKTISPDNLFYAWDQFKGDKQNKHDVLVFERKLEPQLFQLHRDLKFGRYKHSKYSAFYIQDPKQRHIHKAIVRDRILHHAVFSIVNPIFEPTFIPNSYSCRISKGTHKGVEQLETMLRKVSKNNTLPCFVLKCDVRKFFDSVDHNILLAILKKRIKDERMIALLQEIIDSFTSPHTGKGLPLGNLTSQLFANIYMNEFDQFMKQQLKVKWYARYTDDFVIVANDPSYLKSLLWPIQGFLGKQLALQLHPKKVILRKYKQGIDFLGYIVFPHYRHLRTKTKRRMFNKLQYRVEEHKNGLVSRKTVEQCLQSYLGVLSHANAFKVEQELMKQFGYWLKK